MATLYLWADGSGTVSNDNAGAGVALTSTLTPTEPEHIVDGWGFPLGQGTNNHAELSALRLGLLEVTNRYNPTTKRIELGPEQTFSGLVVLSDSEYALGMMTQPWKARQNALVVQELRGAFEAMRRQIPVQVQHCKGHVGTVGNELADLLAGQARERQCVLRYATLPEALGITPDLLHVKIKLRRPTVVTKVRDPDPNWYPRGPAHAPTPTGTSMTLPERRAFQDGTDAHSVGIPREACPYNASEPRTPAYLKNWTAWLKGWDSAPMPVRIPTGNVPTPSEST